MVGSDGEGQESKWGGVRLALDREGMGIRMGWYHDFVG